MTELEIMQRAKMYMDKLAQGIDPITDREVPEDSVLNQVRLAKCFFYVSGVLSQVISNGGTLGIGQSQRNFEITPEQLSKVPISGEPISITPLVEAINAVADNPQMKKLTPTVITNWLLAKGFLEKRTGSNGKAKRVPTANGLQIGLSTRTWQGQHGEYQSVVYDKEAQQFVLDNLLAMLDEKMAAERRDS